MIYFDRDSTEADIKQEGWLAKHAATDKQNDEVMQDEVPEDPMQGLDRLDVAGPQLE